MRVYDRVREVKEQQGGRDLLRQVRWRMRALTQVIGDPIDLNVPANRQAFDDVIDAYAPNDRYQVELSKFDRCVATEQQGGLINFVAWLVTGGEPIAEIKRVLNLNRGYAYHSSLRVHPPYRGNRVAVGSLASSVELYDRLGFSAVRLRACYSGTWYWARFGFEFEDPQEVSAIRRHAQQVVNAFGGGLDVSTFTHPQQFLYLGHPSVISFGELVDAMPKKEDAFIGIAADNGLGMHDRIPFGRAVLLTGPSWDGRLTLQGPGRLIFDDLVRRKLNEAT